MDLNRIRSHSNGIRMTSIEEKSKLSRSLLQSDADSFVTSKCSFFNFLFFICLGDVEYETRRQ